MTTYNKYPVIYLNCHDAGRLIQPYGHAVRTPHLQRFAEEGVFFRQAHCVAPTCSASRAALLTGKYAHQVGMLGLAHLGFSLNDYSQHLAHRLSVLGYSTALSGVQHVAPFSGYQKIIGYDFDLNLPGERRRGLGYAEIDRRHAMQAASFTEEQGNSPFYLECGFFFPHRPFPELGDPENRILRAPPFYLPDTPETRKDIQAYESAMQSTDEAFGIIFDSLKRSGLWEKAIIIVTTDHGPAFPWAKCNLNDQGTGVMLMMRIPGQEKPLDSDALVTHLDIVPTILDVLGVEQDATLQGKSLAALLKDAGTQLHQEVFSEVNYHASYEPMRSIRSDRYRYVRRFDTGWERPVLPNIDDGPSKDALRQCGFQDYCVQSETLYDMAFDPAERRNLIAHKDYAAVRADLAKRLDVWMHRTNDPLLAGPVPLPAGAQITPQDFISHQA